MLKVQYLSNEKGTIVTVAEPHPTDEKRERHATKDFGNSAKAADDGLIFVHGVNHGEIKPDDILPPWGD
jgi:hypothetical protein